MACVLVDVDGTLLPGPSSELRFVGHLLRRRLIGPGQIIAAIAFVLRHVSGFGRDVFKKNKAYLVGLRVDGVAAEAKHFVESDLRHRMREEIVDLVLAHVARGDHVVLLTGTPDFIAAPLARLLGARGACATQCASQDGVYIAEPPITHPFGEAKVDLGSRICRDAGTPLAEAVAYADSIHDLRLLLQVGRPVAAWPDRALRSIAEQGNWLILPQKASGSRVASHRQRSRPS